MVRGRDGLAGPADADPARAQPGEGLRAGDLVDEVEVDTVFVNPQEVPDVGVASEILSRILNMDRDELYQRLDAAVSKDKGYLVVKTMITPEESERLRELHMDWIRLDRQTQRHYPKDTLAAHLLGFVNFEEQGSGGIEMSMEAVLRGQAGTERMLTDVKRRGIESHADQEAKDGVPLVLTIDERIQFVMERELAQAVQRAQRQDRQRGGHESGYGTDLRHGELPHLRSEPEAGGRARDRRTASTMRCRCRSSRDRFIR